MRRALHLILLICALLAAPASAQSIIERLVTPGSLAAGHAKLESHCESCHTSFRKDAQNSKCVACHKGVGADIAERTHFHGKYAPARNRSCKSCHSEHKGRGYALIRLDRSSFNHALTDYPLTGGHKQASCSSCHGSGNNYRGITKVCANCHKQDDPHRGQLGQKCQTCHEVAGWKQIKPFDHASTGFSLTGGHARAGCLSCHAGQRWKGLGTSCVSCHANDDVHKGGRGTNCVSCHNTASWKQASFDHDRMTRFPLKGAHRFAACASCHKQPPKSAKPPVTCYGCHAADDVHKGGNGRDCARCHAESSWKKVSFNHDSMTRFPLSGKHAGIRCESCHTRPPRELKLSMECSACHAKDDVHAGKLGDKCGRCHDSSDWKTNVRFDHALTRFPLLGKHAEVACSDCHADKSFAAKGVSCASCHEDKHHQGRLGSPARCSSCHNTVDWKVWTFDHDKRTRFALTGRHKGLICSACHARAGDPAKLGSQCVDCHRRQDVHRGGFGQDCARCHVTTSFREIVMGAKQ